MFPLACTVRNCAAKLRFDFSGAPEDEASNSNSATGLVCEVGHRFDRSKFGFYTLLQPQDKRAKLPGDSPEAVAARGRWLSSGHMDGLPQALKPWIDTARGNAARESNSIIESANDPRKCSILELGCGEGSLSRQLFYSDNVQHGDIDYCGVDLSMHALRRAAKQWPEALWIRANADRRLPALDDSLDVAVSLFGRRPMSEITRVLRTDGVFIVAVPGPDDLIELRSAVQSEGQRRDRCEKIVAAASAAGLSLAARSRWEHHASLTPEQLVDAAAMTYRSERHSRTEALRQMQTTNITLEADLLLFSKSASGLAM